VLPAEKPALDPDDWVRRMIQLPGRSATLVSESHTTHYLEWGAPSNSRVLLLLHGFLGHAHWWDFIAPSFAADYRVLAIDFGGMGDSSWRARYSNDSFVAEVGAMLERIGRPATIVGHSFGGRIAACAAHEFSDLVEHAIIVDSNVGLSDRPGRPRFAPRPKKLYPDLATACARFRFVPEEPPVLPAIMRHLAERSLRPLPEGFAWKFDETLMGGVDWGQTPDGEILTRIDLPVDFICGELSEVVPPDLALRICKALRHGRGPIVIPSAHHHLPVNQPIALVAALRALLSQRS
jgi:pimeloyl-ACP methyl ester carboxylesterase